GDARRRSAESDVVVGGRVPRRRAVRARRRRPVVARPDSVRFAGVAAVVVVTTTLAVVAGGVAARAARDWNGTRVYVARLRASSGIDDSASTALEEAVLVAAKKARPDLTVIGRSDVAALSDLVAEQAAAGCDAESCAAEIADAL